MPFQMPMFRSFVPERLRPWLFVCFAITFQFSGGLYFGTLNQMMGETTWMREDLLMCLYAHLAGMALYFPLLFRMKFRFTNKTLLISAATGVLLCNLLSPHITYLPLLWAVCFVGGICKIQGTFECMSNIQLWMSPTRDFTVFFPVLHVIILGSMQVSDWLAVQWMVAHHWSDMQYFISALMLVDLIVLFTCTRHFRMFKKFPLFGIDWLGGIVWAALAFEIAYLFNYGEYYDWLNSAVVRQLIVGTLVTLAIGLARMYTIRHPYFPTQMWHYKSLIPVLLLVVVAELFFAAEHVLEHLFVEEVMHYEERVAVQLNWATLAGAWSGCGFSYWWMHLRRYPHFRLLMVGLLAILGYLSGFYFVLSSDIHLSQLYFPVACRGFAYAVMSVTLLMYLEELMDFQHFFQSLGFFQLLHMVVGGVIGAAIYAHSFAYYMADNIARYGAAIDAPAIDSKHTTVAAVMPLFLREMQEVSLRQIYGWAAYACLFLLLAFLLYDAPARRENRLMPLWRKVWQTTYRRAIGK